MAPMGLPTGPAVTFLFTDIEGSTRLEQAVGTTDWSTIVARHDEILRNVIQRNDGVVVKTEGDAFFAAFADPLAGARAAVVAQREIARETWPETCQVLVRMGLHTGEGRLRAAAGSAAGDLEDYVGIDVNYTARIAAAANGGQIVLSQTLAERLLEALGPTGLQGDDRLEDVELVDEGLRAVRDFEEPARLHRLAVAGAADDDRPLRTLEPPSNLPGEVTDLVGREEEIERLTGVVDASRIVTLTGPGGSGKTRLALGLAQAIRDRFPHGTWFVDLAAVRDPGMLVPTVASTLGLRDSPELSLADALRAHLRDRTTLLVLDNLEQLLPPGAEIVAKVARDAPEVRFLITSRELLRIGGERGHPVPPLDRDAGFTLFEARATALRPDLVLGEDGRAIVRQICERLFGLPLAIELAAARIRLLSPALILERLTSSLDLASGSRDLPERQRTLRGAMAWSHDLLSEPERRLFRRLAAFAGGWTAELAVVVADPDGMLGIDVLEGLESLADKSLVRIEAAGGAGKGASDEPRFDLHPLLREYALEQLEASGERAEIEARHAAAIAKVAEVLGAKILSAAGSAAIGRLDVEQHNLRAALDWSIRTGVTAIGMRVMGATWRWFQQRGRLREARTTLDRLMVNAAGDARLRIAALAAEGSLAYWADDFEAAGRAYGKRLALADELGDATLRADAHYDAGFIDMVRQDVDSLREHEQRALDLYLEAGQEEGALRARQALVLAVFLAGDNQAALDLEAENLAAFRRAGSDYQIADSMTFHAGVYFKSGDPAQAWGFVQNGLRWFAENDNQSGIARGLGMAAIISLTDGDAELGARAAGATYQLMREKGVMLAPVKVLHLREPREIAIERLGEVRAEELMAEGAAVPIGQVIEQVLDAPAPANPGVKKVAPA
jgi:predicted ATPase/class 3 adenylate cyclase